MEEIRCFYLVGPHGTGASNAWKMTGVDNQRYLVKFNAPPDRTAINEAVCGGIAKIFEVPALEQVVVEIDDEQCEIINDDRGKKGLPTIRSGRHVGVKLIEPFYTVSDYKDSRHGAKMPASNADQIPGIPGFDTLVQNHDRHCGNVGVVRDKSRPGKYKYCVFDHSHAFGGNTWDARSIMDAYINMQPIREFCLPTSGIRPSHFDNFLAIFDTRAKNCMNGVFDQIPDAWKSRASADLGALESCLKNVSKDALRRVIMECPVLEAV